MKFYFYLAFIFLFIACSNEETTNESEKENFEEVEFEEVEYDYQEDFENYESAINYEIITGQIGDYSKQFVMILYYELDYAWGSYHYVTHQKFLTLDGDLMPQDGSVYLTETYKGKVTGHIEFYGGSASACDYEGSWIHPETQEESDFCGILLDSGTLQPEEDLDPITFSNYANEKDIMFFDPDGNEEYESVSDQLKISHINDKYMAFSMSVTGRNFHTGEIEGFATYENSKTAVYSDESGCVLTFDFNNEGVDVTEEDCEEWHGAYASFTTSLTEI